MQLINTIELNPYDFSDKAYNYPGGSSDERNQFWKQCISDKKLERLEPIRKGSYLVDITTIHEQELGAIVMHKLKEIDLWDFEEQVGQIVGGIALRENDTIYIEPSCCGDVGNIKEWESIFEKELHMWHELWIGHPWVYYRRNHEVVEFSNYTEASPEDFKAIEILVSVPELVLQIELKKIREQQNGFEDSIRSILDKTGMANAERIAKLMTGNV